MPNRNPLVLLATAVTAVLATLATASPAQATATDCAQGAWIRVPLAEQQVISCLTDLTTAGTLVSGHTQQADWAGLSSVRTVNPSGVPGIQIDGYFHDSSTTNTHHGWNHDAQFVMRFPDEWNGKLVLTGAPGVRRQYALDATISDWVLARGYAFASTDKGNTGAEFYLDGKRPGDAIVEWNNRVTELTIAAKLATRQVYGELPDRTYMTGASNGGYLTRWQLENRPSLYDGGVDWMGTLLTDDSPNLFTYLPTALQNYPAYVAGSADAHAAMHAAGFAPGSEFLWDFHNRVYWELTQRIYREEFDPSYEGAEADYDWSSRPASVHRGMERVELTGKIRRPMITLHGTLDALLPPETDSDVYASMIAAKGRADMHRYYTIEDGNHVDGLVDSFPTQLRAMLPCYRNAFVALEQWVENGTRPPASGTVPNPAGVDTVNTCSVGDR